jgi:hypothetical protein
MKIFRSSNLLCQAL